MRGVLEGVTRGIVSEWARLHTGSAWILLYKLMMLPAMKGGWPNFSINTVAPSAHTSVREKVIITCSIALVLS